MVRSLLSISDISKKEIFSIFEHTDNLRKNQTKTPIVDTSKIAGLLFFEPSTRTRIGFEVAAWRMGIKSVIMQETKNLTTMSNAESISDTIQTLNPYVSFYCVRHPSEKIFDEIMPFTNHPVLNCGNGYLEHPTQSLIDAYTIWTKFGRLDDLEISIVGNLKYTRAVHSLILLLSKFSNITINELTPPKLQLQDEYIQAFEAGGNKFIRSAKSNWGKEQVVYVTGFPPKNPVGNCSNSIRKMYIITKDISDKLDKNCIIMNPLPRIDEIDEAVDSSPKAHYFIQNEMGLFVRMAIFKKFFL